MLHAQPNQFSPPCRGPVRAAASHTESVNAPNAVAAGVRQRRALRWLAGAGRCSLTFGLAREMHERKVDLPALGKPIRPTSATSCAAHASCRSQAAGAADAVRRMSPNAVA